MEKTQNATAQSSNTKSVSKTLAILSTFGEGSPMQKTSEIAKKLGMNISSTSRHLNTMLDWGFLDRDEDTGLYYPGIEIIALAGVTLQNNDLFRHSYSEVQHLAYKYNVHSHMGVAKDTDIVHLVNSTSINTAELMIPIGHCHPMYCSAMGRIMMAYMTADQVQKIFKASKMQKHTDETKVDVFEIEKELVRARQKGYCLIVNELVYGKGSLAVPIFDRNRIPVAAISVSCSVESLLKKEMELSKALLTVSGRISGKLGYFPR